MNVGKETFRTFIANERRRTDQPIELKPKLT